MRKTYLCFVGVLILILFVSSCKKGDNGAGNGPATAGLATIGLYQSVDGQEKKILMPVTKIGTQVINYKCIFDTGSAGLVIDASGILPASMISDNGIQLAGDSVNVNGITVTSQQLVRRYGNKENGVTEYGNLAYAPITIGDQNGNVKTGRIPFFLYYKVVNTNTNENLPPHSSDVFGVAPGISPDFGGIGSPLSYLNFGSKLTSGFKLAALSAAAFTTGQHYVPGLLTVGLTTADLTTAGFVISAVPQGGSSPYLYGAIIYGDHTVQAITFEFDTGNPAVSTIVDYGQDGEISLSPGTVVKIATYGGFNYQYTTSNTGNFTNVVNPQVVDDTRTNIGIDFFIHNEYLVDYAHSKIGLKND